MNFSEALIKEANLTQTENDMTANVSTLSACLDLFATAPNFRGDIKEIKDNIHLVMDAIQENADIAARVLLWIRDIRGDSSGNREFFKHALRSIEYSHPELAYRLALKSITEIGRFDDVLWLRGIDHKYEHVFTNTVLRKKVYNDIWDILNNDSNLKFFAAKWLPNENGAKGFVRHEFAKQLGLSLSYIRKFIQPIRKKGLIVEQLISQHNWGTIADNFDKIPSLAFKQNLPTFKKYCEIELQNFFEQVKNSEKKLNVAVATPIDIVSPILNSDHGLNEEYTRTAWREKINASLLMDNKQNVLPIIDTSGSMCDILHNNIRAIDVAVTLGLYFAHSNKGDLKNVAMTFSRKPRLFELNGDVISDAKRIFNKSIVEDTNIEAAMQYLLDIAIKNNIPSKQMPLLVIISDMQFNASTFNYEDDQHNSTLKQYARHGYDIPKIVYWSVGKYTNTFPVVKYSRNAAILNGYNPTALNNILSMVDNNEMDGFTPEKAMLNAVMIPRYNYL